MTRRVVEEAGEAPPGRQRWSTRSLAREVGISAHSVARIWRNPGLKPHRLRTFRVSRDKKLEEKFWDVVGLHLGNRTREPDARSSVVEQPAAEPRRRVEPAATAATPASVEYDEGAALARLKAQAAAMAVTEADKVAAEIRILGPACAQCGARRDGGCRCGEPTDDDDRRAEASLDAIRDGDDGDDPGLAPILFI